MNLVSLKLTSRYLFQYAPWFDATVKLAEVVVEIKHALSSSQTGPFKPIPSLSVEHYCYSLHIDSGHGPLIESSLPSQVMKSELEKLLDGSKRNNVTLSIVFMDGTAFVPAQDIISANQFNGTELDTIQLYLADVTFQ